MKKNQILFSSIYFAQEDMVLVRLITYRRTISSALLPSQTPNSTELKSGENPNYTLFDHFQQFISILSNHHTTFT